MYLGFIIAGISLTIFALLGVYDGFYLHLVKYKLYDHKESKFEHLIHTVRTLLFPLILYFLFLGQNEVSLYLGLVFVVLDIIALGVDAYSEEESRAFMGGAAKRRIYNPSLCKRISLCYNCRFPCVENQGNQ